MTHPLDSDICIYCQAPGCDEGIVTHAADCPQVTHVFPVTLDDAGSFCCSCHSPLIDDEFYALIPEGRDGYDFVVCLACVAMGREVSP